MGRSSCFNYFLCPDVSDETPVLCGVRSAARQLITSIACRSMMLYTAKGGLSTAECQLSVQLTPSPAWQAGAALEPQLAGNLGAHRGCGCWWHPCLVLCVRASVGVCSVCFCVLKGENCGICAVWRPCVHTQNALLALLPSEFQTLAPDDHFPRLCV